MNAAFKKKIDEYMGMAAVKARNLLVDEESTKVLKHLLEHDPRQNIQIACNRRLRVLEEETMEGEDEESDTDTEAEEGEDPFIDHPLYNVVRTCPHCGHEGRIGEDFGFRRVRDPETGGKKVINQTWCKTSRRQASKEAAARKAAGTPKYKPRGSKLAAQAVADAVEAQP